jgi:hypothetical protein
VTTGIYATFRHPSYLGLLMTTAGWALVFRSGVGLIISALFVPIILGRIRARKHGRAASYVLTSDFIRRYAPGQAAIFQKPNLGGRRSPFRKSYVDGRRLRRG